ncbi:MAG: hypothetical protein H0T77_00015 [Pyrinomonadaceae bacterium]|nr:hypothetical protein [Pyrinomonadaceae bacterium]
MFIDHWPEDGPLAPEERNVLSMQVVYTHRNPLMSCALCPVSKGRLGKRATLASRIIREPSLNRACVSGRHHNDWGVTASVHGKESLARKNGRQRVV